METEMLNTQWLKHAYMLLFHIYQLYIYFYTHLFLEMSILSVRFFKNTWVILHINIQTQIYIMFFYEYTKHKYTDFNISRETNSKSNITFICLNIYYKHILTFLPLIKYSYLENYSSKHYQTTQTI